jgi:hypothetical protein
MITDRTELKYSENILPHCYFVTTELTWTGMESTQSSVGRPDHCHLRSFFNLLGSNVDVEELNMISYSSLISVTEK